MDSSNKFKPSLNCGVFSDEVSHPDHLLADSHELEVQFWVHHLSLLQSEDFLMAVRSQTLLIFLQTLDHLNKHKHRDEQIITVKQRIKDLGSLSDNGFT